MKFIREHKKEKRLVKYRRALKKRKEVNERQKKSRYLKWVDGILSNCEIENLWYYVKTNIIRAPLEALLTLYLAEMWMIFTAFFTTEKIEAPQTVYMIFFPLAIAAAVCFIYSLCGNLAVGVWAYCVIKKYNMDTTSKTKKQRENRYFIIDSSFAFVMGVIHVVGALCYGLLAYVVATSFAQRVYVDIDNFNDSKFILCLTLFGLLAGVLWNIYGYHSDRRIDWRKVFTFFKDKSISTSESIRIWKLRYFKKALIWQLICCAAIISFVIYFLLEIRIDIFEFEKIRDLVSYSAFLTLFISILSLYGKQMYNMFYTRKKYPRSEIFPLLLELSPEKSQESINTEEVNVSEKGASPQDK